MEGAAFEPLGGYECLVLPCAACQPTAMQGFREYLSRGSSSSTDLSILRRCAEG